MSKEITITFKASEALATLLGTTAFDLDKTKSEIIRCCLLLGIDTVRTTPSLINRIQIEDRTIDNIEILNR